MLGDELHGRHLHGCNELPRPGRLVHKLLAVLHGHLLLGRSLRQRLELLRKGRRLRRLHDVLRLVDLP